MGGVRKVFCIFFFFVCLWGGGVGGGGGGTKGTVLTSPNNRDSGAPKSSPSLPDGMAMHCQIGTSLRFSEFVFENLG